MEPNQNLSIVIVDDEPKSAELLNNLLKKMPMIGEVSIIHNPHEAMVSIVNKVPDMVFVDQRMPGLTGLDLIRELMVLRINTAFVIITGFDDCILQALKEGVIDYLIKPVEVNDLLQVFQRYHRWKDRKTGDLRSELVNGDVIRFNTLNGFFLIRLEEIVFVRAHGNYCEFTIQTDEKRMITCSMGKLETILPASGFFKTDRSHMIGLRFLKEVNRRKQMCYLGHEHLRWEVPIARQNLAPLAKCFRGRDEIPDNILPLLR